MQLGDPCPHSEDPFRHVAQALISHLINHHNSNKKHHCTSPCHFIKPSIHNKIKAARFLSQFCTDESAERSKLQDVLMAHN